MEKPVEIKARLKEFGGNVRRARVLRKITQEELSEKADLHIRSLQKIEAGQINVLVTTLMRLKQGLDCPWYELLPTAPQTKIICVRLRNLRFYPALLSVSNLDSAPVP